MCISAPTLLVARGLPFSSGVLAGVNGTGSRAGEKVLLPSVSTVGGERLGRCISAPKLDVAREMSGLEWC